MDPAGDGSTRPLICPPLEKQDAQLSQRDRAAGCVIIFATNWKTGTGRQYFTDIIGLPSITVI